MLHFPTNKWRLGILVVQGLRVRLPVEGTRVQKIPCCEVIQAHVPQSYESTLESPQAATTEATCYSC